MGSHRHHVVTLHIGLVVIFTFVVELSEEVESHDGVKVNHHGQEPDSQSQLGGGGRQEERWVFSGDSKEQRKARWKGGGGGGGSEGCPTASGQNGLWEEDSDGGCGLNCLPPNLSAPASQNVTEFGDQAFKEVNWTDGLRIGPVLV